MYNSLQNELSKKFNIDTFDPHVEREKKDENFEADAFAYSNGDEKALFIIEIKTRFKREALLQLENTIYRVNKIYPEHKSKNKYGILAIPHLKESQMQEILKAGFYPATLQGDMIVIEYPENFKAKVF